MQLVAAKIDDRVCEFYIGGGIGTEVNGTYIEADMQFINKNKSCDRIDVKINSEGGSVINGIRIITAILNSKIPVHTYNIGYAMSMGGFIWLSAKKENRHMSDFARLMLHAPRFVNETGDIVEPDNDNDKMFLQTITQQLSYITEKTTGKSELQISKILAKDSFYTASEAVEAGFMHKANVMAFDRHPQFSDNDDISGKINKIAAFYKEINQNKSTMKTIAAKLKLNSEASETAIAEKIDEIVSERDEAINELRQLQEENNKNVSAIQDAEKRLKSLEEKLEAVSSEKQVLNEKLAMQEVEAAISEGVFKDDEESKKSLVAVAVKDIEVFRSMKKVVKKDVKAPDLQAMLNDNTVEHVCAKFGVEASELNYGTLWAKKPDVLNAIKADMPKLHESLEREWIKSNE